MTGTANNRTSQSGATPSGPSQRERDIGVGPLSEVRLLAVPVTTRP
ncbi:MAG: hypothetical protein AAGA65_26235 [Actinomycetota bacterium]